MLQNKAKTAAPQLNSPLNSQLLTSSSIDAPIRQIKLPFIAKPLNTPQVYKAAMYGIIGSTVLLTGTIAKAITDQRSALKAVGFDTTPSIYQAQRIRDSVADMDANIANLLLVPTGKNPEAATVYKERKEKLSILLTRAAQNITIPLEQKLISDLSLNINNYIEKAQTAQVLHSQNKIEEAVAAYREAQEIVDKILMPTASELDTVNFNALKDNYQKSQNISSMNTLLILLFSIITLGALIGCQILLAQWTKRRFNLGLLGATIVSLLFVLDTLIKLQSSSELLNTAKNDAFDSLHALRQARSIAYSLNADESRYLLDVKNASQHQNSFFTKVKSLAQISGNTSPEQSAQYSQDLRKINQLQPKVAGEQVTGFFGEQLKNVTFPGEDTASQKMVQDFLTYFDIDRQIRTASNRQEAITLCTGKSNEAFAVFLKSHSKVMDINIEAFDSSIYKGLTQLDVNGVSKQILAVDSAPNGDNKGFDIFWIKALLLTGTIAGLTIYGLRSRILEYEL